jgi:hypothetical protein
VRKRGETVALLKTGYNLIELNRTILRAGPDGVPVFERRMSVIGYLHLLRSGGFANLPNRAEIAVFGLEDWLYYAAVPSVLAGKINAQLKRFDTHTALEAKKFKIQFVIDGELTLGERRLKLTYRGRELPLASVFIALPELLERDGQVVGYHTTFKLTSG